MSTEIIERLRAQFLERRAVQSSTEPGWLGMVRTNALERFLERGFPTTKDEEWRFTSLASLTSSAFALSGAVNGGAVEALKSRFALADSHELVFVNGVFSAEMSSPGELPEGVLLARLTDALSEHPDEFQRILHQGRTDEDTPLFDLNEAFLLDGACVLVPKGVVVERPIHFLFLTTGGEPVVTHPRNIVVAGQGAQFQLVETYAGADDASYWTNGVTQVAAGGGAVIDHYKLQLESSAAFHTASVGYVQERDASVANHSLSLGARLARHDIRTELRGEGTDVTLNGLYVVGGSQHVDHHTVIDHQVPRCTSRELYKGVLDDRSSGVFNGRVIVRADAQKTDSKQSNKNLLLSKDALVNTNPQLEINADDVKCAHGATIGQLAPEAMFYLRSRGIGESEARRILTEGFMADVSDRIRLDAVRDTLRLLLFSEAA